MRKIFLPPELYLWIENMDDCIKWKLFDVIYRYNLWMDYILDDSIKMIFWFFKPFFDNDVEIYKWFCDKQSRNWKLGWRPKASFVDSTDNQNDKPKKAKKPKKAIEVTWSDIYTRDSIFNSIDIDKYKSEFPNKNIEIEFDKMFRWWENNWKRIKKPNQAFSNWLAPKKFDKEYIEWITEKTEDQRITEFLSWKNKFNDKYWWDKYQEVKDLWIKKCLAQPLVF